VAEEFAALDKSHKEIDAEFILEDVFHINQEGMVDSVENVLLHCNVFHLVMFNYKVLTNAFHCV